MFIQFVHLEQLAHFAVLVHHFRQNIKTCRRVNCHLPRIVHENLIRSLLSHNARANLKIFQEVEQTLLAHFHNGLLTLHRATFQFMLEIQLVDVQKYPAHISQQNAHKLIKLKDCILHDLRTLAIIR